MTIDGARGGYTPLRQMLYDHIDQLDLALDQLALKDRNFDRFAIMLVDNVVELTLHRHAQEQKAYANIWSQTGKPPVNPKVLVSALGQKFDAKVSLALQTGLLTGPMSQSINWLHSFRNSSYHAGLRHEGILHSLANFYLRTCCDLLVRYRPASWSSGSEKMSHRVAKYLGSSEFGLSLWTKDSAFDSAWERLRIVASSMRCNLIDDLFRDMESVIDLVDGQIAFYVDNAQMTKCHTRDAAVIEAQIWPLAFSDKGVQYAQQNGCKGAIRIGPRLAEWLRGNYKPSVASDPVPKWRDRLQSLRQEKAEHAALEKYCNFLNQTLSIRGEILRQNDSLWQHIEEMSDRARER